MKKLATLFCLLIMVAPVTVLAQKVSVDFASDVDFSKYQTYRLQEGTTVNDDLLHQRIVAAIEYHLAMNGIRRVEVEPDMHLVYHTAVQEEVRFDTMSWGYGWRRAGGSSTTTAYRYQVGTLVVDMWDASEEKQVWRGLASSTVTNNPEKKEKRINKAVEKMFEKFPPGQ